METISRLYRSKLKSIGNRTFLISTFCLNDFINNINSKIILSLVYKLKKFKIFKFKFYKTFENQILSLFTNDFCDIQKTECLKYLDYRKIILYDAIPKENFNEYCMKLLKFQNKFVECNIFLQSRIDSIIKLSNSVSSTFNTHLGGSPLVIGKLKKQKNLCKFFKNITINFCKNDDEFFIVSYCFDFSDETNRFFKRLLLESVLILPSIKLKISKFKLLNSSIKSSFNFKGNLIDIALADLKSLALKYIKRNLNNVFLNKNKYIPSLILIQYKNKNNIDDILKILPNNNSNLRAEKYCQKNLYFVPNDSLLIEQNNNFTLFFDSLTSENDLLCCLEIFNFLSDLIVYSSLTKIAENKFASYVKKINKKIAKKCTWKLIKTKLTQEEKIFFYIRLSKNYKKIFDEKSPFISNYKNYFSSISSKENIISSFKLALDYYSNFNIILGKYDELVNKYIDIYVKKHTWITTTISLIIASLTFIASIITIVLSIKHF